MEGRKMRRNKTKTRLKLGDAELEIMQIVWKSDKPLTSGDISRSMDRRKWALSTLMTCLARLERKGFLNCDRSTRSNLYTYGVAQTNYLTVEGRSFVDKLYNSSVKEMIINFYSNDLITRDQLRDLRVCIETLEKEA
jgi:predicted transcriptional regulator